MYRTSKEILVLFPKFLKDWMSGLVWTFPGLIAFEGEKQLVGLKPAGKGVYVPGSLPPSSRVLATAQFGSGIAAGFPVGHWLITFPRFRCFYVVRVVGKEPRNRLNFVQFSSGTPDCCVNIDLNHALLQ